MSGAREGATHDLLWPGPHVFILAPLIANHMNELALIERVRELRHEISAIQSANRKYWGRSQHSQEENKQNERRRERLQEIN